MAKQVGTENKFYKLDYNIVVSNAVYYYTAKFALILKDLTQLDIAIGNLHISDN
jgi:hypothetical protein